jgi:hypothetical protein
VKELEFAEVELPSTLGGNIKLGTLRSRSWQEQNLMQNRRKYQAWNT